MRLVISSSCSTTNRSTVTRQITDLTAAAPEGFAIRAWVEAEQGHVTSTGVVDAAAQFFTVYELDDDGLVQAISDHPRRGPAGHALDDHRGRVELGADTALSDEQVGEHLSKLRKGKPTLINGVRVQKTGTYGRDRRPVFLIGGPTAGGPYVSVIGDKVVPDELRRHHKELAEYNELSEAGKAAYDEARISEAACHHQAMRIASAAAPAPTPGCISAWAHPRGGVHGACGA
jgi:hypothetical protein